MKKVCDWLLVLAIILSVISCSSLIFVFGRNGKNENTVTNGSDTQIEQQVDWSNVTISCLGDSITNGDYLTYNYPTCLKNELGVGVVYNLGINGCTIAQNSGNMEQAMCLRYSKMDKNSDIIIIMGGVNDSIQNIPLGTIDDTDITTYYGALNTLCSGLKENYPNSWVFFMTSFKYDNVEEQNGLGVEYQEYYCNAVKAVCAKYNVDIFDTLNSISFDETSESIGVHPRQAFVGNKWVPAIAQYIKTNYKQK